MPIAGYLELVVDSGSVSTGEAALDRLARTGSRVEGQITVDMGNIESAIVRLTQTMGNLDKSVQTSMARVAGATSSGARSFEELRRAVDPAYNATVQYTAVQRELATMVKQGEITQRTANIVLEQASSRYMGVATAAERAAQAEQQQAQQTQALTTAYQSLRMSLDPVYSASVQYESALETLNSAERQGIATKQMVARLSEELSRKYLGLSSAAEMAAKAERDANAARQTATQTYEALRSSIDPLYATSKRYESAIETLNNAQRMGVISDRDRERTLELLEQQMIQSGQASLMMRDNTNRYTMAMNNASFQVQDFFVQIAAGTDVMRALSMQLPQFLSSLGMVGRLATIGASLGVVVAAASVLIPMLFETKSAADITEEAIEDLTEATGDYARYNELASQSLDNLSLRFGNLSADISEAALMLAKFAKLDAIDAMDTAITQLTETFGGLGGSLTMTWSGVMTEIDRTFYNLRDELRLTDYQAAVVIKSLREMDEAATSQAKIEAAVKFNEEMVRVFGSIEAMPNELREVAKQALLIAVNAGETVDRFGALRAISADLVSDYQAQEELTRTIFEYGEDSAQAQALHRAEAEQTARAYAEQQGLTGQLADDVVAAAMAAHDAEVATENWAAAMSGVRAELAGILSMISQLGGGMISLAAKNVEMQALKAGKSLGEARYEAQKFREVTEWDAKISAAQARGGILGAAEEAAARAGKAIAMENLQLDEQLRLQRKATAEAERAANKKSSGSSKAAKAAEKAAKAYQKELDAIRESVDPFYAYNKEMEKLVQYKGELSDEQFAKAVSNLNEELADSLPLVGDLADAWGDFVASGFQDFEDFVDAVLSSFKNMIAEMIATAARNQIIINMGMNTSGLAGAVGGGGGLLGGLFGGGGGGMLGGAGGLLGQIGGAVGGFIGGISSGVSAALSGVNGIFAIGANALQASALTGASMLSATIGAALPVVGIAVAAFGLVKKLFGRKLKDVGVQGQYQFDSDLFFGETYKRYGGNFFSGAKTKTSGMSQEDAQPFTDAFSALSFNITQMTDVLGLSTDALEGYVFRMKMSTKGLSEEEVMEKFQEQLDKAGSQMAKLVMGTSEFIMEGESAYQTLERLSTSLASFNASANLLSHNLLEASLQSGHLASIAIQSAGGMENFTSSVETFFNNFYSQEEQLEAKTRILADVMEDIGLTMPTSAEHFRFLLDSIDITNEAGAELYGTLIGLSGSFAEIFQAADSIRSAWRGVADDIAEYIRRRLSVESALQTRYEARSYNEVQFQMALASAMAGDIEAAQGLTDRADSLIGSVYATSRTRQEAAIQEARILNNLRGVEDYAESLTTEEAILDSSLNQEALLQELIDLIAQRQQEIEDAVDQSDDSDYNSQNPYYSAGGRGLLGMILRLQGYSFPEDEQSQTGDSGGDNPASNILPQFSGGGNHMGGLRVVGERGPELERTGPSSIYSSSETRRLLSGADSEVVRELRALRDEVATLRGDSNTLQSATLQGIDKMNKLQKKWDNVGLPVVSEESA